MYYIYYHMSQRGRFFLIIQALKSLNGLKKDVLKAELNESP